MEFVIIVLILLIVFVFIKVQKQIKEVNFLNNILYEQKEPEKYIEEMDKILSKKQTEKSKTINTIQKTTGMLYAGRFDEVVEILEKFHDIPKNWLPIYYQNLVLSLYFKKDRNKANEVFKAAKPSFEEFKNNQYYKEFIDIVYSVSDFYNGKGSRKYYSVLSQTGANDYRKSFGYYFLGMIDKKDKNMEEAENNLKNAMKLGRGSFIERFSMQ